MDIRNIQTFIQVAEIKSFTKAANEMNYVQSTVTMQIQQLERELGFPLFDRIGKSVSLTAYGEEFLAYAYELVHIMHKVSNLSNNHPDMRGTLRVGVVESLMFSEMVDILPRYKEAYKNIDIKIKVGQTTELLQLLKQNLLDTVYISTGLNTDQDLCCYYKCKRKLVFVSSPEYAMAKKEKISIDELFENNFIVTEHTGVCYSKLKSLAAQNNAILKDFIEIDSVTAVVELLRRGMGLAFLPDYSVEKHLQRGELVKLNVEVEPQIYYSQVLCHRSRWVSPFMESFVEEIKKLHPQEE